MDLSFPPLVLLVGTDLFLLQTRRAVLKTAGVEVLLAESAAQARVAARHFRFQTVILCHTIDAHEQDRIASDLHAMQSKVPVVRLSLSNTAPESLIGIAQGAIVGSSHTQPSAPSAGHASQAEAK